jgi:hypothetical protein
MCSYLFSVFLKANVFQQNTQPYTFERAGVLIGLMVFNATFNNTSQSILVSDWSIFKKPSPLKPLVQMSRNLVESIY